jgi:Na+/phosphate symporter
VASELNNQIQELNSEHQATLTAIENLKEEISSIQEPVEEMLKEFEECQFTLEFNKKLTKDEGFVVNEQNVEQYLGELEEYLSSLLTHLAYEKGAKVPMVAGLDEKDVGKMNEIINNFLQSDNLMDEGDIEEIPLSVEEFQAKSKDIITKKFGNTQ